MRETGTERCKDMMNHFVDEKIVMQFYLEQLDEDILIDGESVNIPKYLKATRFYTKEEYAR